MSEKDKNIGIAIKRHRELEIVTEVPKNAIGRCETIYNGEARQFWIINSNPSNLNVQQDLIGNVNPQSAKRRALYYEGDGIIVFKRSVLGKLLNQRGKHKYKTPNGEIEIEVLDITSYIAISDTNDPAIDITIRRLNENKPEEYRSLLQILEDNLVTENRDKRSETDLFLLELEEENSKLKQFIKGLKSHVRNHGSQRYQGLLDEKQDEILTSNVFTSTLIIKGGPGTGKTTSLIQRIKYLTSNTIQERIPSIEQDQLNILLDENKSWIFFSPNELLALFLRNTMQSEMLSADNTRVKVWRNHQSVLMREYKLFTENQIPFIPDTNSFRNVISNDSNNFKLLLSSLHKSYLNYHQTKLGKILSLKTNNLPWRKELEYLQKSIGENEIIKGTTEIFRIYRNIQNNYQKLTEEISHKYGEVIKELAAQIQISLTKNKSKYEQVLSWIEESEITTTIEETDDDSLMELESFDELDEKSVKKERKLFSKIKSLCRKISLIEYDKATTLTRKDNQLFKHIETYLAEFLDGEKKKQIGTMAFYKKRIERITKGVETNFFDEIHIFYKKFRKNSILLQDTFWNTSFLGEVVKVGNQKTITYQEQSLLLGFINELVRRFCKFSPLDAKNSKQKYVKAYLSNSKAVIGIDEASDFSLVELFSMKSLEKHEISQTTLCGDLMQSITTRGIEDWSQFTDVFENTVISELNISYRQSQTLINLAVEIYQSVVGEKPNYKSNKPISEFEPKPLFFNSKFQEDRITWLTDRIIEICIAYEDRIPTIAVFVPTEEEIDYYVKLISEAQNIINAGIPIRACKNGEVLGDDASVRVFSIKVIKGLEFESVFFCDLHSLIESNMNFDEIMKTIYVGISRATLFMGLTSNSQLPSQYQFMKKHFSKRNEWQ